MSPEWGCRETAALVRAKSAPGVRRRKEPFNQINRPVLGWVRGCLATWGFLNGAIGETKPGGETKATSLSCPPAPWPGGTPGTPGHPCWHPGAVPARWARRDSGAGRAPCGASPAGGSAVPRAGLSCRGGGWIINRLFPLFPAIFSFFSPCRIQPQDEGACPTLLPTALGHEL